MWHKSLQTKILKNTVNFTLLNASSAKEGEGSAVLSKWVKNSVYGGRVKQDNSAMISNVRHISLMEQARAQVEQSPLLHRYGHASRLYSYRFAQRLGTTR